MASVIRIGFCQSNHAGIGSMRKLLSNSSGEVFLSVRCISGKAKRAALPPDNLPPPFPWKERPMRLWHYVTDRTSRRFVENTKVLIVDGPIAVGKSKLAKALADDLGMQYFPEANQDMWTTNSYGYNCKQLNDQLPNMSKFVDIKDFLINPKSENSARFQFDQLMVKYSQYVDALAHVFNTGQGVVLDRSCFSDFVFVEAMYRQKFISKGARKVYYELRNCCIPEILHPHLVIYLDVPAAKVLEKIKQRNNSIESKSSAMNLDYLKLMEEHYKREYLKQVAEYSELLVYDWTTEGDVETVVEDIERIDFTPSKDRQDFKFKDWVFENEEEWALARSRYTNDKDDLMSDTNIVPLDVPELLRSADDAAALQNAMEAAPGGQFIEGYNKSLGDKGIFFKTRIPYRQTLPLLERQWTP